MSAATPVVTQPADETPAAFRFLACSDPDCHSCHIFYCMKCSETNLTVLEAKSYGERPLSFADLESDGKEAVCETCDGEIYRKGVA